MSVAGAHGSGAVAGALIERATLEVTARDVDAAAVLKEHLPSGEPVHITHLANGDLSETIAQAKALALAGLEPVPHIAARSLPSAEALGAYVARIVGEAGASGVLLIAGDLKRPLGPFAASLDVLRTGVLEQGGIKRVGFASHPEGHPSVPASTMAAALADKLAYAKQNGLGTEIITQFCFEAEPIVDHVAMLRRSGVTAHVRIGAAAPTNAALMLKFALRCGIGPSARAIATQSARLGQLAGTAGPEDLIADLAEKLAQRGVNGITGLHFFVFGSVRKAAAWLAAQRRALVEAGSAAR